MAGIDLNALLQEGNRLLMYHEVDEARAAYLEVWERASEAEDDYFACAAAHLLGAMESISPEERLQWHLASLERAKLVTDGRVDSWYASIYVNLGYTYRLLDQTAEALAWYEHAMRHIESPAGTALAEGLRLPVEEAIEELRKIVRPGQ